MGTSEMNRRPSADDVPNELKALAARWHHDLDSSTQGSAYSSQTPAPPLALAREPAPPPAPARIDRRLARLRRCLVNLVLVAGFYAIYALIRNTQGSRISAAVEATALSHGLLLLDIEQRLGLDHEASVQSFFLRLPILMKASNIFYATAHFIVTAIVLATLTIAGGRHHSRWRNILGLSTAMALVGFALYPTMPPRLLPDHPALIDTLSEIGGFWSFQTPAIEKIADPFAALPSLHVVWAAWVTCAVWSRLRRTWLKVVAVAYPVVSSVVVVATANHYLLDILAGLAVLGLAALVVTGVEKVRGARGGPEPASSAGPGRAVRTSAADPSRPRRDHPAGVAPPPVGQRDR